MSDYVRDAGALVLLLASLGTTWNADSTASSGLATGGDHWWVVLSVLAAVASLVVPYVVSAGVVPALGAFESILLKSGLNLPVLVCVLVTLINEVVDFGDFDEAGVGVAVGLALTGCALAAQPRASEGTAGDRAWSLLGQALPVAAVVVSVLGYAAHLVDDLTEQGTLFDDPWVFVAQTVLLPVLLLVLLGVPLAGLLGGNAAWRRVFGAAALGVAGALLLSQANEGDSVVFALGYEKWNSPTFGSFLIGAAGAAAVGHALARRQQAANQATHPAMLWARTASSALVVSAATLVLAGLGVLATMVATDDDLSAAGIVIAVMLVLAGAMAGACVPLASDPRTSRPLVLGLLSGVLVVGVIVASLVRAQDVPALVVMPVSAPSFYFGYFFASSLTAVTIAALFVLPVLAAVALTAPRAMREALGPLYTPRPSSTAPAAAAHPPHAPQHQHAQHAQPQPPAPAQSWEPPSQG